MRKAICTLRATMSDPEWRIVRVGWRDDQASLCAIRQRVFVEEQGVPEDLEWEGDDEQCEHFLAIHQQAGAVGCARLRPDGRRAQIGRLAVLPAYRRLGIGRAMLEKVDRCGIERGYDELYLHAQTYAQPLYESLGYLASGAEFQEAGIAHRLMTRRIEPVAEPVGVLNQLAWLRRMVNQARRSVDMHLPEVPGLIGDDALIWEALSALSRERRERSVRLLCYDAQNMIRDDHAMLRPLQRMPSKIAVYRVPQPLREEPRQDFILVDGARLVTHIGGRADPWRFRWQAGAQVRDLQGKFDALWARSFPDPNLRQLHL